MHVCVAVVPSFSRLLPMTLFYMVTIYIFCGGYDFLTIKIYKSTNAYIVILSRRHRG